MSDDDDRRSWTVDDLVSDRVREFVERGLITSVVVSVAFIDDDGAPAAACIHDDDTAFWTLEGLLRSSLRDVVSVSEEATRRRAQRYIDRHDD